MADILLRELSNQDLDWLINVGHRVSVESGLSLNELPGIQESLVVILDGWMNLSLPNRETPVSVTLGDVIGAAQLLEVDAERLDYQASEPSLVLLVPLSLLRTKLQTDREFAVHFYRAIALLILAQIRQFYASSSMMYQMKEPVRNALTVFGELHDSDLDWLVSKGQMQRVAADDFLLQAGRPVDALYIILDGAFSVAMLDEAVNPFKVCFNCPVETAATMTVVSTLTKGEMTGAFAFLDPRPISLTIRAVQESLVLAIPRPVFMLKLQHDLGFAARFYKLWGAQLMETLQWGLGVVSAPSSSPDASAPLGMGDATGLPDELDLDALQKMTDGAHRFNWMLSRLGVGMTR